MAKKRIIVPILALILVLLMSVGMLVACNDDPQSVEYTVTFTQGDGTSSTVTVKEGTALTAEQIPEYVIAPGSHVAFDGWFADETEIKAGYVVSANVTATARTTNLYTVTFKNGDEVVKEVEVRAGAQLAEEDIPPFTPESGFAFDGWYIGQAKVEAGFVVNADAIATPTATELFTVTFKNGDEVVKTISNVKSGSVIDENDLPDDPAPALGYGFVGWFVGEDAYDETAEVTANIVVEAKFERNAHLVTFMNGEEVLSTVVVAYEGSLAAAQIPAAVSGEGVFVGYYNDDVKATEGVAISGDVAFVAMFTNQAAYTGRFVDTENGYAVTFSDSNTVNGFGLTNKIFTYNENGTMSFKEGSGLSAKTWTMTVVGDSLFVECAYFDEYEDTVTDSYRLARGEGGQFVGTYQNSRSSIIEVVEGDVVIKVGGSSVTTGKIVRIGETEFYKIVYTSSSSSTEREIPFSIDEKGNMVNMNSNDIYVKGVTGVDTAYNADFGTIFEYSVGAEKVFVLESYVDDTSYYCTVDPALAEGLVVVSYVDYSDAQQNVTIKIDAEGGYVVAGAERGTYTGADGELVLDGFGAGTLGGSAIEYTVSGNIVVVGAKGYALDGTAYTVKEKDQYAGIYISGSETIVLDGFGGATYSYYGSDYVATYEINAAGNLVVDVTDAYYLSGEYTFVDGESNNVFQNTVDTTIVFIKDGYVTPNDFSAQFNGWWKSEAGDYIFIDVENKQIKMGAMAELEDITFNWNGSAVNYGWYQLTMNNGKLVYDDVEYSVAEEPVIVKDSFAGVYVGNDNMFYFDGYGKGYMNTTAITYAVNDDKLTLSANGHDMVITIVADGLNVAWDDGEYTGNYKAVAPGSNAFTGTWVHDGYYRYTLMFFGDTKYVYVASESSYSSSIKVVEYKINSDNAAVFTFDWTEYTCTIEGDVLTWTYFDMDGFGCSEDFQKQSEETIPVEADYIGRFVDSENGYCVTFGENGAVVGFGLEETFTYNAETGAMTFTETWAGEDEIWTMLLVGDELHVEYQHVVSGAQVTDKYTLVKAEGGKYVGTYVYGNRNSQKVIEVIEGDVVIKVEGSNVALGKIVADGDNFKIVYRYSLANSDRELPISIDAKGNFVITESKAIYVKGATEFKAYNNSDLGYIYEYAVGAEKVIVFECTADRASYYCTADVALADGARIVVSYVDSASANQQMTIEIEGTNYVAAGAECGTYSGDEGELVLDGFGAGTLNNVVIEYTVSGNIVIVGDKGYALDGTAYTVKAKDGYQGVYIQSDNANNVYTLDGFGGVAYKSYTGTYTVDKEQNIININVGYSADKGAFAILEDGNVLDKSGTQARTLVKQGYNLTDYLDGMVGYYESADKMAKVEVISVGKKVYVRIDTEVFEAKSNYNHSVLTITINSIPYTIAKEGDGIKVSATIEGTLNEISLSKATKEAVSVDTTSLFGKWELFASTYYYTFEFKADGKVTATRSDGKTYTVTYTQNANKVTFSVSFGYPADYFNCTFENGVLSVSNGVALGNATKIADPVVA